ncbi:MAG: hypothetical protein JWP12_3618 [Bacteroidetes bacterium]|nr:hypothetical protein [Bacteroidota bacterium]
MKKITNWLLCIAAISTLMLGACKKEEIAVAPPVPGNEFMTTVKVRLQSTTNPNDTIWAAWRDLTPDDTNPPDTSMAVINIKKNTTYTATVHFYDETKTPVVDITPEIQERANYHTYWFFQTGGIIGHLTTTATDHDTNSPPIFIGLANNFVTDGTVCSGRLEGVLRHQPNSKNGTFAPGSTDSDVFFTLNIIP